MITDYVDIIDLRRAGDFIRKAACDNTLTNKPLDQLSPTEAAALLAQFDIVVRPGKSVTFVLDSDDHMHVRIPTASSVLNFPNDTSKPDPEVGKNPGPSGVQLSAKMREYPYAHSGIRENYQWSVITDQGKVQPDETTDFHIKRLADYSFSHCY